MKRVTVYGFIVLGVVAYGFIVLGVVAYGMVVIYRDEWWL